jgi:hypothetical protein
MSGFSTAKKLAPSRHTHTADSALWSAALIAELHERSQIEIAEAALAALRNDGADDDDCLSPSLRSSPAGIEH